jgi:hypothetical protein
MSKNSQVRKIDLRANVDLANYRMDVHDYEGFCGCNSLFLNKRIQSWYTRGRGSSEVTDDLRIEANGDMFELWRNNTKLGEVSRNYYKLESYEGDTTRQTEVKNPFPQGKEKYFASLSNRYQIASLDDEIIPLSNNWHMDVNHQSDDTVLVSIYDSDNNYKKSISLRGYNAQGYYSENAQTITNGSSEGGSGYVRLSLNAGDILITTGYQAVIYNIYSQIERYNAVTIYAKGGELEISNTSNSKDTLCYLTASHYGGFDLVFFSILCVLNNKIYFQTTRHWGVSGSSRSTNTRKIFRNNTEIESNSKDDVSVTASMALRYIGLDSYGNKQFSLTFESNGFSDKTYTDWINTLRYYVEVHNYSKLIDIGSHGFAINFVNNVARDISHNYKKLVNIEGNEDANGVLTDIINYGYEEGQSYYIWIIFKKGNVYYKLSLAYAESWEEVVTKVGSDYLIFNTTTYNNAYYIPGNKWFCSCDDWNNRLIWRVKDSTNFEGLVNSRLNQNWQTKNYPVAVSDQLASVISRYAVTGLNMAAYPSSATWDGSSVVYDSSGNPVYTGDWAQGHSLNGYYYPLTWEINTAGMTPFYYDSTYTAPAGVAYDVFMADTSGGTLGALHKVGYADSTGFHSDPDSGTQFIDPSEGNYQFNCPLLDTTYLIFTTQAIAIIDNMSYILMNNVNMGNFVLLYREQDVATLTSDDRQFVINGSVYTYRAEAQRILDSNNRWVCDTHLFHYVGYSSRCAYFYCDFDKGLYAFSGDNTMNRLATVEKYNIRYSVGGDSAMLDTLNFPSLDLVLINLFTAVGVIYGDQFAVIDTGNITNWSIDDRRGLILINGVYYSLILANIQAGYTGEIGRLPIKIDTEYYGDPNNEDNTITDTVYLMIDNLNGVLNGNVKLRADVLQNNKVVKTEEKIFNLKSSDFNENIAQIKYQPKIQEGRGMKLYIESDYEISEMKFAAAPGALNQTTKRI